MCTSRVDAVTKQWFLGPAVMLWLGIYFTGFDVVHWLIYIPATMAVFAFVSGRCPGMYMICKRKQWMKRWRERDDV